jgi:hypothetical protein
LSGAAARRLIYLALLLAFALHTDVWNWDRADLVLGLPIGLTYHVVFCLAVALVLFVLTRFAWPYGPKE